ncbi:MAG TPA: AAA domain-containing protein [Ktedonobacterales bacterium]|nr:AAA domain-containing protein [Ktedonobacterales bacterium]
MQRDEAAESSRLPLVEGAAATVSVTVPVSACFVCSLAPQPCEVAQLDGRLLRVHVPAERGRFPVALLETTGGEQVRLALPARVRAFAQTLAALPAETASRLHLRAFHLRRGQPRGDRSTLIAGEGSVLVLEPDLLLNITDLNNAEYCVRQYPLRRLVPSPPSAASLRGTIVHAAFKELLKGGDEPAEVYLTRAIAARASDLAFHHIPREALTADARPHLAALQAWYHQQRASLWGNAPDVRAETFLLGPPIGLKGRLDFLIRDSLGAALLELKSGAAHGPLPRREHRWQVYGYQTLLAALRPHGDARPGATLLYSGTPGHAETHGVPFTLRDLVRVLDLRNALALTHVTGEVPPPPGGKKCARCALRPACQQISPALGWLPPDGEEGDGGPPMLEARDLSWLGAQYGLLRAETLAAERQAATLWRLPRAARVAAGIALDGLALDGEPLRTPAGEWEYTFRCRNRSELREGDEVLLSDGDPIHGEVVSGTILALSDTGVTVWTPERIARPAALDRYSSDIVGTRTLRNLWRWLDADPRLRLLVAGERAPHFRSLPALDDLPAVFNVEQRTAIARALAAEDFLCVQGPPGTGKTRVVAEIARRAVARGERVLVAAFTNQAVDNVLARLLADGYDDFIRLGHALAVAPAMQPYRLEPGTRARVATALAPDESVDPAALRETFLRAPLAAATTAMLSSERFDDAGEALRFDLVLVDEASQLTVPAVLGALRFARRFVLVGDERQLPPLVVSEEAAKGGLSRSLFGMLLARWSEAAVVSLIRQYRMHPTICAFPAEAFYDGQLIADGDAQFATLDLALSPGDPASAVLDPARPLVFVDVPADREPGGKLSATQANLIRQLVLALRAGGLAASEIGVVAPYRAQVALIRQRLAAHGECAVMVDTVDRFQGGERRAILFSFGGRAGGAAASLARADFLADPRRLNVALTRAQRKLILVGDAGWLADSSPLLDRLIAHCAALYGGHGGKLRAGASSQPS